MIEVLGYIALAVVVIIGAVLAFAATRPDRFSISRTARIDAPRERIFPLINNLHEMNTWNPFALRNTGGPGEYSGSEAGVGAAYAFSCPKSGTGRIEIQKSTPSNISMRLQMMKPFKADNAIAFTLKPVGDGATDVTWEMSGKQPLVGKVIGLFISCDTMMGSTFEEGLMNLKVRAERQPVAA